MAEESLRFRAFGEDVSAGRMFGNLADKADDAGESIHGLGDESKDLDARLKETRVHVQALIKEFENTGDTSLFRDIRRDRSTISMIESMRKELRGVSDEAEDVGRRIGQATSRGFGDAVGSIPSQLKGVGILTIVALAPLLTPVLGAAVGGAVLGGVGLGGVVGGVAAAAQDQRIKDFGTQLGENFVGGFKAAGRIFVNPLLDQMSVLKRTEDIVLADLASGFAALAPVIKPLAEGIEGLAENLNLGEAFGDAVPFVRALAQELPEVGAAIGDAFESIGDGSDGATEGLLTLLHITEDLIRGTGEFIRVSSNIYDWFVRTGNAATDFGLKVTDAFGWMSFIPGAGIAFDAYRDHIQGLNEETQSLKDGLRDSKDAGDDWNGSLAQSAISAREAADAANQFEDAIRNLFGQIMGLDEAQIRYNTDLLKLRVELKEGAKSLAINTEEGLKNRQAILGLIRDIEALREAHIANNMPTARANELYEQQVRQLIELAVKTGFSRREVEQLAGALRDVPKTVELQVEAHGLDPSLKHAIALNKQIDELDGRVAKSLVITEFYSYRAGERELSRRASGGPVTAGQSYWVGEQGPEIITVGHDGYVTPAGRSAAMAATGGTLDVKVSIDPSGARDELAALFVKMLRVNAGFRDAVASYVGASA